MINKYKPVVMILAAGKGERMRPLTDILPKPLLLAKNFPLIGYQMEKFTRFGISHFVVNISHLAEKFSLYFQADGSSIFKNLGVTKVDLSPELPEPLETAAGIAKALPLIIANNPELPFFVVSSDAFLETNFENFYNKYANKLHNGEAVLLLVENPEHHKNGDFCIDKTNKLQEIANAVDKQSYTYSGIGIFTPKFFDGVNPNQPKKLNELFKKAIMENRLYGEFCDGFWIDIGTPQRLQDFEQYLEINGIPKRIAEFLENQK